ncbi:hypothetical protein [Arcanobacterium phocae]|uniref:hypothetical protein n=1 Tax=Arcanobacterium phocae TaxID=131112 RepID=UPI001C0ED65E|nr:hypothetical protein [Arcanobacterium phocae]
MFFRNIRIKYRKWAQQRKNYAWYKQTIENDPRLARLVTETRAGKNGKGQQRKTALGDDYTTVQNLINASHHRRNQKSTLNNRSHRSSRHGNTLGGTEVMTPHERTLAWEKAVHEGDWDTAHRLSINANQRAQVYRFQAGAEKDQTFGSLHTRYIMQALELEKEAWMLANVKLERENAALKQYKNLAKELTETCQRLTGQEQD